MGWSPLGTSTAPPVGWLHSLNQQKPDPEDRRGGRGNRVGEHLSPLQWEEAVVPGCGSRARGQGQATKRCPFGGSVALPWLRKMGERVPPEPGCTAYPPAPHAAVNSLVTKSAWSPRGYLS